MARHYFKKCFLIILAAGWVGQIWSLDALAVPSFKRQTGMSCTTCHTVFPELTPFGRAFKISGFTFSTGNTSEPYRPPIAAMVQASATFLKDNDGVLTNGVAPFDNSQDSATDKFNFPQQASLFYGGKIIDHAGALAQVTYDGTANDIALDLTDIRYEHLFSLGSSHLALGLTLNNSPTVEDLWNSTPTWGFPYASSAVAPTPAATPLINGVLSSQVGGLGAYASWYNWLYGAFTVYRTTDQGIARPLGAGTDVDTEISGFMPYWRLAAHHDWGSHSFEVGTYGLYARVDPEGFSSGSTNKFTDLAVDAQYQLIAPPHLFSIAGTWINESQNWDGSYKTGAVDNRNSSLDLFKVNANYHYRSQVGTFGGSVGYFVIDGDKDTLLYAPNPVDGSRTGSPNSSGFILEVDYVWQEQYKFSVQYTLYNQFNGSGSNYDGSGRDASDNNTVYFLVWLMF